MNMFNKSTTGWIYKKLSEVSTLVGGGTPSRDNPEYFGGEIVWLTPTEIPRNQVTIVFDSKEKITEQGLNNSSAKIVPEGTVLMTSRASIGYVAIAGKEVTTNQGFASFICNEEIYNHYLAYWLLHNAEFFKQEATGTTFKEISKSKLRTFKLPIPPVDKQKEIVSKIEELFTQLDAGTAALKRVQMGLKRYKASVLKAAVEGRLVPQNPNDEPAEKMLRRLGKKPLEWENLPELPKGWCWITLENITVNYDSIRVPLKASDRELIPGEFPYYGASGVIDHVNDYLFDGDYLLIAEDGANLLSRRTPIAFQAHGKFWVNNHAHVVKTVGDICLSFLEIYLNSIDLKLFITGTAQPKLTQANLNILTIPVPPINEQLLIMSEIDRSLTVAGQIEKMINQSLRQGGRLRQSILNRAFYGLLR